MSSDLQDVFLVVFGLTAGVVVVGVVAMYAGIRYGKITYPGHLLLLNLVGLFTDFYGAMLLSLSETNFIELKAEKRAAKKDGANQAWNNMSSKGREGQLRPGDYGFSDFIEISDKFDFGIDDSSEIVGFEEGIETDSSGSNQYFIYQITEKGDRVQMVEMQTLESIISGRIESRKRSIQDTTVSISSGILAFGFLFLLVSFFLRNFVP